MCWLPNSPPRRRVANVSFLGRTCSKFHKSGKSGEDLSQFRARMRLFNPRASKAMVGGIAHCRGVSSLAQGPNWMDGAPFYADNSARVRALGQVGSLRQEIQKMVVKRTESSTFPSINCIPRCVSCLCLGVLMLISSGGQDTGSCLRSVDQQYGVSKSPGSKRNPQRQSSRPGESRRKKSFHRTVMTLAALSWLSVFAVAWTLKRTVEAVRGPRNPGQNIG